MIGRRGARYVNRNHPLLKGAVAWWKVLPHTAGGAYLVDLLGRYHGTPASGLTWQGAAGRPGGSGALGFNGTTQQVSTAVPALPGDFSIFAWVRQTATGFFETVLAGAGPRGLYINSGVLYYYPILSGVASLSAGVWYWVGVTVTGGLLTLYLNAALDLSTTGVGNGNAPAANPLIGYDAGAGGGFFNGAIDDVMFLGRALSAVEVYALYAESRAGCPNLLPRRRAVYNAPTGGATTWTIAASDKVAGSDSVSRLASSFRQNADSLGLSDSAKRLANSFRAPADSLGLSDPVSRQSTAKRIYTDNLGLTDTAARLATSFRKLTDNLGVTDLALVTAGSVHLLAVLDKLGVSDSARRTLQALRALSDSLGAADSALRTATLLRLLADSAGVSDTAARKATLGRLAADSIGLQDVALRSVAYSRLLTDMVFLGDLARLLNSSAVINGPFYLLVGGIYLAGGPGGLYGAGGAGGIEGM